MNSDSQVMNAVKSGDIDKLSIIFERYKIMLFGYFYKNTFNRDISEDLVQNVFIRILKYRNKYDDRGRFKSWMFQIAHNILSDYFKKKKRDNHIKDYSYSFSETISTLNFNHEEQQAMLIALNRLNHEQREVLILSKFQELKYKDIAIILNISEANVKVRIHRAIKELKNIYHQLTEIEQ